MAYSANKPLSISISTAAGNLAWVRLSYAPVKASGACRHAFARAKKRFLPMLGICCTSALFGNAWQ
jgi:hypothetical protein